MRTTIKQEFRNYRNHQALRSFDRKAPTMWVAKITGINFRGLTLDFIKPVVDFANANSKLSRGVFYYWHLEAGFYDSVLGSNFDRKFLKVENGQYRECSKDEVMEWLNDLSA